jgi:hypothetical protein
MRTAQAGRGQRADGRSQQLWAGQEMAKAKKQVEQETVSRVKIILLVSDINAFETAKGVFLMKTLRKPC